MNYSSKTELIHFLVQKRLALKKRFGQNFLLNKAVCQRLVTLLAIKQTDTVWEIGPGLGALTAELLERAQEVVAFEIDWGLIKALQELFPNNPHFKIIPGDAVKTIPKALACLPGPDLIIGNLPYASSSQIIFCLTEVALKARLLLFTVQRELAARLTAKAGHKNLSAFSLICQASFQIEKKFELAPGNFYPSPKVYSTVIALKPRPLLGNPVLRNNFIRLVQTAFHSRRKTLANTLLKSTSFTETERGILLEGFEKLGIKPQTRAEELSLATWLTLTQIISDKLSRTNLGEGLRPQPVGKASGQSRPAH